MITKVQKWGNSQGLRLSKEVLAGADLEVGDAVEIAVSDGTLVITPVHRVRGGAKSTGPRLPEERSGRWRPTRLARATSSL